jgi:uncharacterized protein (TIGR02145 family)
MNPKSTIWFCSLIVMVLVLIITYSCKKEEEKIADKEEEKITDVDGNVYSSVTIGTQVWMGENLKTTKYSNGDFIGTTTPATLDISAEATPKYQWANDGDEDNVGIYGRLYTWYAVTDSRNLCPTGWHLTNDAEWTTLQTFLGGEGLAGGKLKEAGSAHWITPNIGATNESGFTALPSGSRSYDGIYDLGGTWGYWWSSTESSTSIAVARSMYFDNSGVYRDFVNKRYGFSVRCLRDY